MNNMFFILCVCGIFVLPIRAQNILKGNVLDESNISIPAVTVRILTVDSAFISGEVTDNSGNFLFNKVKAGGYIFAVSCIGYVKQFVNFEMPTSNYTFPKITLKTDNIVLNPVEIIGSRVIYKKDHLLIIPDKQQIKHAFSGYDLLYNLMIPGLTVDRRKGTATAMTGVATIYINGVKADFREVQNLGPKDIERVEYYTLPTTGRFVGDAASINYITKIYKTGGYITLDGEQNIGYLKGDYNIGSKISHNNTSCTFFGGYNIKEYDGVKKEKSEKLFLPDYTIDRNTTNDDADFSNNQQYAQFKVSNDNKKHNLSGTVSFVRDLTPHNDRNEILNYIESDEHETQSSDKSEKESLKPTVNLNGIFHLTEKQQVEVRLNGAYTRNFYSRIYTEGEQHSFTNANEDLYSFDTRVAYFFQADPKNSFYGRVTHFHNITSSLYSGDYDSWQHLWKGETLVQIDYVHNFGEKVTMSLSPGLSLLNYKLHGNSLQRFWTFRTNSWVRYFINSKHWAGIGFSLGNNQPEIDYLSSMDQTIDFYQIKRGNPNLDNTKRYFLFMMYAGQIKLFNIQSRFGYTKDVYNIYTNYYLEGNKLISSYSSDGSYNSASAEFSVSSRISDNLRVNLGLKYQYMHVPNESKLSQNNFTASFDMNYFIKSFAINAYVKTKEKTLDETTLAFMKIPASYGLSVRYNSKKWMAEMGTENPFTKHAYYREYADYGVYKYNQVQTSRIYQQTGYIKLAYTFDFGKRTSRESNNVDRSINSAILKVE